MTGSPRPVFDTPWCIRTLRLARFPKKKKLLQGAVPGKQPGEPGRNVYGVRKWIASLHSPTRDHRLGCSGMRVVSPEYDVIEIHAKIAEWVARYWLSIPPGESS